MDPTPAGNRIEASHPGKAAHAGESGLANADLATATGLAPQPKAQPSQSSAGLPSKPAAKISIDPMRATDRYPLVHPPTDQF